MNIKKIFAAFAASAAMLICGTNVYAQCPQKVYDYADLITDETEAQFEERLEDIADTYGHDIVIYTTDESLGGHSPAIFSEKLAKELDLGINGSGALFLVSMDERDYDIGTFGTFGDEVLVGYMRDELAEDVVSNLSSGNYKSAFSQYITRCEDECRKVSEKGPNSQKKPMSIGEAAVCILIAFVISAIIMFTMKAQMKTTRSKASANDYVRKGSFSLKYARDIFLYSNIVRTKIESQSGSSSSYSSGSGSGHSGGKF